MAHEIKTVVTERTNLLTEKQLDKVEIIPMPWWKIVLVRAGRVYLMSVVGLLGSVGTGAAAASGMQMPVGDFSRLFLACAGASLGPAVISLLTNGAELLAKLDQSHPSLRA